MTLQTYVGDRRWIASSLRVASVRLLSTRATLFALLPTGPAEVRIGFMRNGVGEKVR